MCNNFAIKVVCNLGKVQRADDMASCQDQMKRRFPKPLRDHADEDRTMSARPMIYSRRQKRKIAQLPTMHNPCIMIDLMLSLGACAW